MKVGLISDTHGWIHPRLYEHFAECDEIWHAGDIGNLETADSLAAFKPLRAVFGNIDNHRVRVVYPETQRFTIDEVDVWMTHIGGSPGNYHHGIRKLIYENPPDLFICGHSHIARVMHDKKGGFLYLNPGAAGYSGFHKFMTALRFTVEGKKLRDMELIELGERGKVTIN